MSSSITIKPETKEGSFLNQLLQQFPEKVTENTSLEKIRQQARLFLAESNIPSKKDEEWRFIDLSELLQYNFQTPNTPILTPEDIKPFTLIETTQSRLVFVNGVYAPDLSDVTALPEGVYVGNVKGLSGSQNEQIVKYLEQEKADVFAALNTAQLNDIAIIWAKANTIVETPIQLLFLTVVNNSSTFSQPRGLIIAEEGASLQLVEYYGAVEPENPYFTNAVTDIWVKENAQINHSRIQWESGEGFHIAQTTIAQSRDSRYTCNEISLGGKLYRHNLNIFQRGEQTQTNLNGLTSIKGKQVSDTHSAIYLNHPYGTTNQLHKCIVDEEAHAIFNGKVFVPKPAQLTNAAQLNRNLLLSPKARVNTKPELQITADNVKCSHGATVSQLEADEVFYLRSRGLNDEASRRLLINAFATELIDKLPLDSLRQKLTQYVSH